MTATETATTATDLDAISWFEIPTLDLDRAAAFYELLLDTKLRRGFFGEDIAMFPSTPTAVGGCLVKRDNQRPSDHGVLVYLNCDSGLEAALARIKASGLGAVVLGPHPVPGGFGQVACVRDTEGNHVALHQH